MGSGIAFELTRSLRVIGAPMPRTLIVSSARAPQDRTEASRQRDPSDAELIEELKGLGALTEEALKLTLPLLRADSRLYRNYIYHPGPPLEIPIIAYGGAADASISPEQLDRWRDQTTASFTRREFEGGHFYIAENRDVVLEALRKDLVR
jgi:surfactin synthase thioesterase subunit